jgi:hypothetical protein
VTVPIVCSKKAVDGCDGALSLRYGGYRLGGGAFVTEPGHRDPVLIALTKKGKSLTRAHHRLRVKLYVAAKDGAGKTYRKTRSITLLSGRR